jgi:glycosyltransferase involved in cell wall biosynthesis
LIKLATLLKWRIKTPEQNWLSPEDIENLLVLAGYEVVKDDSKVLCPVYIPLVSEILNRFIAPLPFFRAMTLLHILIARPIVSPETVFTQPSVSVIVPARNEADNIENAVLRLPVMGPDDELIFVEGNSTDNTWEKIKEVQKKHSLTRHIIIAQQDGKGKGDAVRKGFSLATKDILMILDADLTVPPEDLPKFYNAIARGRGEFINGSRLVYPMEGQAMRFLNMVGNKFFALSFSFVLGQTIKDTLCGTKVLSRYHYSRLIVHRKYFGDFDPFGDFDLLFGAARLGLKIVEVPIGYRDRVYGNTNISRWRHGTILLRMLLYGGLRLRFI